MKKQDNELNVEYLYEKSKEKTAIREFISLW